MTRVAKLSVVLPVRDGQQRIATEVRRVLEAVSDLTSSSVEIVVVDDGSRDATPEILDELRRELPQLRVARHRRPLGMEAAGQTGLERATGELVFIQEDDEPLRISDLMQLYKMGADASVVAARAQSSPRRDNAPLLRRLRAWGARAVDSLRTEDAEHAEQDPVRGLQMVRRPHLQLLASRGAEKLELTAERVDATPLGIPVEMDRDAWCAESMRV